MKKLLIITLLFAACTAMPTAVVSSVEPLSATGQSLYTVKKDTVTYTFIDEPNKYKVGDKIQ